MELIDQVREKCFQLEKAVEQNAPNYKVLLKEIHEKIRETPELVYALKDEEIAIVVSGLSKWTGVEIETAKKADAKKISKKQASLLSEDDV